MRSLWRPCIYVFALISMLTSLTQAQSYLFGKADFSVGDNPIATAIGDFNGDGTTDIAVLNTGDDTVSVLLGRPDGTFAPQVTYGTGKGPLAIAVGDFDGDGNLDLAVTVGDCKANMVGGPTCDVRIVGVLMGNGDGSFRPHVDYATGTQPSAVAVGDFNGDSKLDLAVANTQDNTVSVLLGNGDGTFQNQTTYPTVNSPQSVIVADFNADEKMDLAVGGGGVSILLGNGDGTFQKALFRSGGEPLVAADFNKDGKLDLYAGGDVLLGNGDGTFVLYSSYGNGVAVAAADLNHDGNPDLVITQGGVATNDFSGATVTVLLGNGDGTFQTGVQYGIGVLPDSVVVADFNGDGQPDVATTEPAVCFAYPCPLSGTFSVLLGLGNGSFVGAVNYASQEAASQVLSADFNGDGKPDLAADVAFEPVSLSDTPLSIFLGTGDGTLQPEVFTSLAQITGGMASADFNGDGKADLALTASNCTGSTCLPGDALILIGNGDGTFQQAAAYPVGLQPEFLAVGDFNGDGKPDLAVSNLAAGTVSILINKGDGTFQSHTDYAAGSNPSSIVAGDFRGTGTLDLAVVNPNIGTISILLGKGDGTFSTGTAISLSGSWIVDADFNGDGKTDLAVVSGSGPGGEIFILLSNGDGTFRAPVSFQDGEEYGVPSVADINGDGKPDLVFDAGLYGYISSIVLGNGDGSFQAPIFNFLSSASSIAVADFNGDGSPDLASALPTQSGSFVSVLLSTAFKAVSPSSLNFGSQGVATTSVAANLTISNPSNVVFDIDSIAASGSFSEANNCGTSLAIGAHCSVNVSFSPTATGTQLGTITITDNTKISPSIIPLSGIGVSGPFLTPFPARTNLGSQLVGKASAPANVTLSNTGNASLNVSGISITGVNAGDFAQSNNCGSLLAAGAACTATVTFTPTAAGSRLANIVISDTAPGSPQTASLFGVGLPAPDFDISISGGSTTSQTVSAGQSANFHLTASPTNAFSGTVHFTCSISPVVNGGPTCALSPSSLQLSASTTQSVAVTIETAKRADSPLARQTRVPPLSPMTGWTMFFLTIVSMGLRCRQRASLLRSLSLVLGLLFCVGCGGSSSSSGTSGTAVGTYTATVIASSGSISHNIGLQVIVQ